MKKNILLYGASRSGKTTLAKLLNERFDYNVVSLDAIVSAFGRAFPQLNINHSNPGDTTVEQFKPFLWEYIKTLNKSNNKKRNMFYCIEGAYFNIDDILQNKNDFIIIILVEKYRTYIEYYDKMKKFDRKYDWTYDLNDAALKDYAKNLKNDNVRIIDYCKKNNLKFYNTADNREIVLNRICEDIEVEINLAEDEEYQQVIVRYGELGILTKCPSYLIGSLQKKYRSIFKIEESNGMYDYSVEFLSTPVDQKERLYKFDIPHVNFKAEFTIDNINKLSKVYFTKEHTKEAKKKIVRNFIMTLFTRLYQLKGALLMHCACVEKNGEVLLIVGNPNSGKTVTMLNMLANGFNFITNDFLIIDKNSNRLEFLPSSQYIGIRKNNNWLNLKKNKKYALLKSEGYINVTDERIYLSPEDLIGLNNVGIGSRFAKLRMILFPMYMPNHKYEERMATIEDKNEILKDNIFNNFIDYSSKENYENDFYKINVDIKNKVSRAEILNQIVKTRTYIIKQNEHNAENLNKLVESIFKEE